MPLKFRKYSSSIIKQKKKAMTEISRTKNHLSEQELIALAASWDDSSTGRHREKDGTEPGWSAWSGKHAQRNDTVAICKGREGWMTYSEQNKDTSQQISIVSWNILSDTWWRKQKSEGDFEHTETEQGDWSFRRRRILEWIEQLNPDVLTLQEFDYEKFELDLHPELAKLGYAGKIQTPKKKADKQPCGNATFWKDEKLHFRKENSTSRTQCVVLSNQDDGKQLCVINVHLESSQSQLGADRRARQLNSALSYAAAEAPTAAIIIGGDFNTGKSSNLLHALRDHEWHGHSLSSVYEHPDTYETFPVRHATFMVPGHHYCIDHILYGHDDVKLECALDAFREEEREEQVRSKGTDAGFPSELCPSDHIPIGAMFELLPQKAAEETVVNDEMAILEERQQKLLMEWRSLKAQQPTKITGKPTPEQIAERKAHAALVKEWKATLQDETENVFATNLVKGRSYTVPFGKK